MTSSMGSFVADQVVSKSADELGHLGNKATALLANQPRQTKDTSVDSERETAVLKYKKRLKDQHRKRETQRRTLRHQIRSKYGIKESERHKARIIRDDVEDEKSKLVEAEEDDTQCCCCFCLSYLFVKQELGRVGRRQDDR